MQKEKKIQLMSFLQQTAWILKDWTEKMLKEKNNRLLLISLIGLMTLWGVYSYFFYKAYSYAEFLTDTTSSVIAKLVYVLSYFSDSLLPSIVIGFLLLNVNLLVFLIAKFLKQKCSEMNSILVWLLLVPYVVASFYYMTTSLWPLMLILIIITLVIGYILYAVYKRDDQESYADNEVIKEAGPFESQDAANDFYEEFKTHWQETFTKRGLQLAPYVELTQNDAYILTVHVRRKEIV